MLALALTVWAQDLVLSCSPRMSLSEHHTIKHPYLASMEYNLRPISWARTPSTPLTSRVEGITYQIPSDPRIPLNPCPGLDPGPDTISPKTKPKTQNPIHQRVTEAEPGYLHLHLHISKSPRHALGSVVHYITHCTIHTYTPLTETSTEFLLRRRVGVKPMVHIDIPPHPYSIPVMYMYIPR